MANHKNILEGQWKEGRDFVPDLLRAKAESDRKNYSAKHDILRRLIQESPGEFLIDSEESGIYGITHRPSGFKIHLLKDVTPPELTRPQPKEQDKATVLNRIMKKHSRPGTAVDEERPSQSKYVRINVEDAQGQRLLHHFIRADKWGPAAGIIEKGESPEQAAVRELVERTGYQGVLDDFVYDGTDGGVQVFSVPFEKLTRVAKPGELGGYSTRIKMEKHPGLGTKKQEDDVYVHSSVPAASIDMVKKHGLLSSQALLTNPEALASFLDSRKGTNWEEDEEGFKKRVEEELKDTFWGTSYKGPSVFFGKPDPDKITDVHPTRMLKAETLRINLSKLLRDYPKTRIAGSELQPYDPEGPESQGHLQHYDIDLDKVREYAATDPKELWKHYDDPEGINYASDVPHAQLITPSRGISPEYLEFADTQEEKQAADKKQDKAMVKRLILADAINSLISKETGVRKDLADALVQSGVPTTVVTNAPPEGIREQLSEYPFDVYSQQGEPRKEDPEFFRELLKEKQLAPEEVFYFDHNPANLAAARKAGIRGVPYTSDISNLLASLSKEKQAAGRLWGRKNPTLSPGWVSRPAPAAAEAAAEAAPAPTPPKKAIRDWIGGPAGSKANYSYRDLAREGLSYANEAELDKRIADVTKLYKQTGQTPLQDLSMVDTPRPITLSDHRSDDKPGLAGEADTYWSTRPITLFPHSEKLWGNIPRETDNRKKLNTLRHEISHTLTPKGPMDPLGWRERFPRPADADPMEELLADDSSEFPLGSEAAKYKKYVLNEAERFARGVPLVYAAYGSGVDITTPAQAEQWIRKMLQPKTSKDLIRRRDLPEDTASLMRHIWMLPPKQQQIFIKQFSKELPYLVQSGQGAQRAQGALKHAAARLDLLKDAGSSASEKATVLNRIMKKHSRPGTKASDRGGLKPDVKLQPHQQRVVDAAGPGIRKLLYHGLGSGKTLSAIAAAEKTQQPYGVVVPAALRPNFAKEQEKFTDEQLASDVQSYTMLARGQKPEHTGTVIMDEAHRLRNPDTEQTRVAKQLAEATDQLYLLSGSPIVNAPADLAPLMEMLTQETTTPEAFNEKYLKSTPVTPSLIDRWKGVTPGVVHDIKNKKKLHEALRGRVDYHEPAESPVAREEERIVVDMSPEQEQLHNEFYGTLPSSLRRKLDMQFPLSTSEQKSFLAFLSGPRQVALSTAPWQSEDDRIKTGLSQSPKLQRAIFELEAQIEEDPESRAVVFSNFITAGLEPYAAELESKKIPYGIFHGGLNDKQREELVNKYNSGDLRVLLMGPSGGEGLSLEGTKLIQLLDPHWNETRLNQAIGRGIRYDSHDHLPEKDRKVKVQRFISQLPEKKQTGLLDILSILMGRGKPVRDAADAHLENYARDKQRLNDRFLAELKNIGTEKGSVSKQAAEEQWIGVDLDGTLAKYRGWKGDTHIGNPIPSMVSRVKRWLREGKAVKIFTARVAGDNGTARRAIEKWCETHIGQVLPITCVRDKQCVRIWDDRSVGVKSNSGRQVKLEYADKIAMVVKLAKARSKSQQRLFGMVHAAQKGKDVGSAKVQEMAKKISPKDVSDFAETQHKGLPSRKRKEENSKDKEASANVLGLAVKLCLVNHSSVS